MKQWDVNWGLFRKKIVFADGPEALAQGIQDLLHMAGELIASSQKAYAFDLVKELAADLSSCLTVWKLDKCVTQAQKEEAIRALKGFLAGQDAREELQWLEQEAASIAASQFARIMRATDRGELFTYWGNDLCTDVDFSLRRGASYTTSNPSKINLFRQAEPERYAEYLKAVIAEEAGLSKQQIISRLTVKVISDIARKLRPIYEATNGAFGVSFTQVCPFTWNSADDMKKEVLAWFASFQKELGMERPNVVFKMPATPAALEAARDLIGVEGIRLTMTSNFAVGQHRPFYDVLDGHQPNCFLVIVDCHLRKFAHPEFEAMGVDADLYCEKLVHAVVQKCYRNLLERGSNLMINGAGMREDVGIRLCLTATPQLPMTLTLTPALAKTFDSQPRDLTPIWDQPISQEDMDILNRSGIFRQAYYADEFPWNDIRSFQPFAFMMDGFEEAHNACLNAIPEQLLK